MTKRPSGRVLGVLAIMAALIGPTLATMPAGADDVAVADGAEDVTELAPAAGPTAAFDGLPLDQVTVLGSHNTYDKVAGQRDRTSRQITQNSAEDRYEYLFDALGATQMVELDLWPFSAYAGPRYYVKHDPPLPGSVNHNNCPEQGRIDLGRHQDLRSCIEGLRGWHDRNPNHPLVMVKLELKPGFVFSGSPATLDDLILGTSENAGARRLPRELLFTPRDLMGCDRSGNNCRYRTPDEAVRSAGWPAMGQLRGKFLFTIVPGEVSTKGPDELRNVVETLKQNVFLDILTGTVQDALQRLQARLPLTDGPRVYAAALRRGEAQVAFPTPLLKQASGDPRPGYFFDGADALWSVSFDMEVGYIESGAITKGALDWFNANRYLYFITESRPAPACPTGAAGDRCRRLWISRQADTAQACRDAARFAVDDAFGAMRLRSIQRNYGPNAINIDQDRQGLSFVDQYGGGTAPVDLGGPVSGAPAAITWRDGRHDLFARGFDGQLWQRVFDPGACRGWDAWQSLGGGAIGSDVTVTSWGPDRLDLFARSVAGTLVQRTWTATTGWSGWVDLGGGLAGAPAAAAWSAGRLDVFVRGTDGGLWQRSYDGGRWLDWQARGLAISAEPAVGAMRPGRLDVLARDGANRLVHLVHDGGWRAPVDLGGGLLSRPAVAVAGTSRLDVFVVGTDGQLWQRRFAQRLTLTDALLWDDGWSGWQPLGRPSTALVSAASWGSDRSYVYTGGAQGGVSSGWYPA